MKDDATIARLLQLRRRREQKSNEVVIHHQGVAAAAFRDVEKAGKAIVDHRQQSSLAERAAFEALIGQQVSTARLHGIQGRSAAAATEDARLQQVEETAQQNAQHRQSELHGARRGHHAALKAVTKLEKLLEDMRRKQDRHRQAVDELRDEDNRAGRT